MYIQNPSGFSYIQRPNWLFFLEISKCAVVILNCNTAICNQDKEKMLHLRITNAAFFRFGQLGNAQFLKF